MRRLGLFLSWLLATVVVTVVAFRVVGAAESQIGDAPLTPVVAITEPSDRDTSTTTTTVAASTTTMPEPTATTEGGPTTTTTIAPGSTTTTVAVSTTTEPSTPTTVAQAVWTTLNVPTDGGTVTVEHRAGEIRFVAATARAGYRVGEIEPGPPEVEVEFERGDHSTIEVRVRWSDEGPSIEIRSDSDDDGDGD